MGREPDLLSASLSSNSSELGKPNTGNRFDSPTGAYGVRYFATELDGCYGETPARFRADKKLAKVIGDEWSELGFMSVGDIPADWRQRRGAVRVRFPDDGANVAFSAGVQFLDIESVHTREALWTAPAFRSTTSERVVDVVRGKVAACSDGPAWCRGLRREGRARSASAFAAKAAGARRDHPLSLRFGVGRCAQDERTGPVQAAAIAGSRAVHCTANTAGARIPSAECGRRWL